MTELELAQRRIELKQRMRKEGYDLGRSTVLAEKRVCIDKLNEYDMVAVPTETMIKLLNRVEQLLEISMKLAEIAATLAEN